MASLRDLIFGTAATTTSQTTAEVSSSSAEEEEEEGIETRRLKRQRIAHHPLKKGSYITRLLEHHGLTEKTSGFNAQLAKLGATSLALDVSLTFRYSSRGHSWSAVGLENPRQGSSVKATRQVNDLRQATEQVVLRGLMSRDLGIALSALGCRVKSLRAFDPLLVDGAFVLARRDDAVRECVSRWLDVVCEKWTRPQFSKEIMYRKPQQEYYYKTFAAPKKDQLAATWIVAAQIAWLSGSNNKALECLDSCATNTMPHVDQAVTLRVNVFASVAVARRAILQQKPSSSHFDIYDPAHLEDVFESLHNLSERADDLVVRLDEARRVAGEVAWKTATKQQQTWMIPLLACLEAAYFGGCGNDPSRALRALVAIYPDTKACAKAMVRLLSTEPTHQSYPRAIVDWLKIEPASDFYGLPDDAVKVLYDASVSCSFDDDSTTKKTDASLFPWSLEPNDRTKTVASRRRKKKDPVVFAAAALHVARFVCDNYDSIDLELWHRLSCAVADLEKRNRRGTSIRRRVFFAPGHDVLWTSAFFQDTLYYKKDDGPLLDPSEPHFSLKAPPQERDDAFSTTFLNGVPPKLLLVGYRYYILCSVSRNQGDRRFLTACRDAFKFEMSRSTTDETSRSFIRLVRDMSLRAARKRNEKKNSSSSSSSDDDDDDALEEEDEEEEDESSDSVSSSSSSDSDVGVNPRRTRPLK